MTTGSSLLSVCVCVGGGGRCGDGMEGMFVPGVGWGVVVSPNMSSMITTGSAWWDVRPQS